MVPISWMLTMALIVIDVTVRAAFTFICPLAIHRIGSTATNILPHMPQLVLEFKFWLLNFHEDIPQLGQDVPHQEVGMCN